MQNRSLHEENRTLHKQNRSPHHEKRSLHDENRTLHDENRSLYEEKRTLHDEKQLSMEEDIGRSKRYAGNILKRRKFARSLPRKYIKLKSVSGVSKDANEDVENILNFSIEDALLNPFGGDVLEGGR